MLERRVQRGPVHIRAPSPVQGRMGRFGPSGNYSQLLHCFPASYRSSRWAPLFGVAYVAGV
jgi:hypothetical protein